MYVPNQFTRIYQVAAGADTSAAQSSGFSIGDPSHSLNNSRSLSQVNICSVFEEML